MRARLFASLLVAATLMSVSRANADTIVYSSIPDLSAFAWINAWCSDCGPLAQDQPLAFFSLSSPVHVTGLNLVTGPIFGDTLYAGLGGFTLEIYNSDHSQIIFSQPISSKLVAFTANNTAIITGEVSGLSLSAGTYWVGFYADVLGLAGFLPGTNGLMIETTPHTGIEQFPLVGNIGYEFVGAFAVPGPIAGAGLPGLVMVLSGLIAWQRRRYRRSLS